MIEFNPSDSFALGSVAVERLKVEHKFPCCGYLLREGEREADAGVRTLAYISDCHVLPDETLERIHGVDVLVLNCLRERPHPTHLSLGESLAYIASVAPKRTYLIHMCHDISHSEWLAMLPAGVEPAYDGLELCVCS